MNGFRGFLSKFAMALVAWLRISVVADAVVVDAAVAADAADAAALNCMNFLFLLWESGKFSFVRHEE